MDPSRKEQREGQDKVADKDKPGYRTTDNVKKPNAYSQYLNRMKTERQAKIDKQAEEERLALLNKKDVIEAAKQAE